ncbi:MBL fold metallo-hydrolase [Sphingomonas sp. NFR15]|uniref:MBL fold metallo-hydrolase n=1 Tax=Sphingomonas sp. NFR15 TaxID=1566282 RepID=UPI000885EFA4|nr:MBL fold metallo-hydrolase [Sphingomonas sp. NFR15]SDA19460.1 Glyoxylase, beta-lactamase superfamily II [Sphingomonas sp. NFR15]
MNRFVLMPLAMMATVFSSPAVSAPAQIGPAATSLRVGNSTVIALRDMLNIVPNDGSVFGKDVGSKQVAAALSEAGAPTDRITLGVDALFVRQSGRNVLIDTGLGPKAGGALMASLAKAGVKPDAISDILITHSHGDHVGGLVTATGARAFPKAAIHMSAAEWVWMQQKGDPALVAAISARMKTFQIGATVLPGIVAVGIAGHTPGHVAFQIGTGGSRLLDIGDLAHSAILSLGHPAWIIGYDTDGLAGRKSREAWLARLAASGERVFAPHFPFPGIGRIKRQGGAYAWQPDVRGID